MNFKQQITKIFNETQLLIDEPMKNHTSFKIGGKADFLLKASNVEDIIAAINLCKEFDINYFIMGNGTNLLISDKGFRGLIIKIFSKKNLTLINETTIKAFSGTSLKELSNFAISNDLAKLEFADGIPGTVGGAIFMNAGAYGGEMKQVVKEVTLFDTTTNKIFTLTNEDMHFDYRKSILSKKPYIVLSSTFSLEKGDKTLIKEKINSFNKSRRDKQPLEYPSAGSTFKRPEGFFAGKLIMDSNLSGVKRGGAVVSPKHCGFVINEGTATCSDVIDLIDYIIKVVKKEHNITLEPEIRMLGEI